MKVFGDTEEDRVRRERMVESQIRARGVSDPRVLDAMREVPRHLFVDPAVRRQAYDDHPIPIREGQTISQPYIVAAMTQALELKGTEKVLEIGTGSGYQTAILALVAKKVFTVERHRALGFAAENLLADLKIGNVLFTVFDGTLGWRQYAPYEAILVTAYAPDVPAPLVDQLAEGGRLVVPVGDEKSQRLLRVRKRGGRAVEQDLGEVRFVRLVGRHGWAND